MSYDLSVNYRRTPRPTESGIDRSLAATNPLVNEPLSSTDELSSGANESPGIVFHVQRKTDNKSFSIKRKAPGKDFDREVKAIRHLHNQTADSDAYLLSYIIRIEDEQIGTFWPINGERVPAFVMEDLPIGLETKKNTMCVFNAIKLVTILAKIIAFCHRHGVIHRDLKPLNIRLRKTDGSHHDAVRFGDMYFVPVVVDFDHSMADEPSDFFQAGEIVTGSLTNRAPEQLVRTERQQTNRVDIWQLGVILYECVAKSLPFDADGDVWRILTERPRGIILNQIDFGDMSASLDAKKMRLLVSYVYRIYRRCMAKDASLRYANGDLLADDLAGLFEVPQEPKNALPITPEFEYQETVAFLPEVKEIVQKEKRWSQFLKWGLGVFIFVAIATAIWAWDRNHRFEIEKERADRNDDRIIFERKEKELAERAKNLAEINEKLALERARKEKDDHERTQRQRDLEYRQGVDSALEDLRKVPSNRVAFDRLQKLSDDRPDQIAPRLALLLVELANSMEDADYNNVRSKAQKLEEEKVIFATAFADFLDHLATVQKTLPKIAKDGELGFFDLFSLAARKKSVEKYLADFPLLALEIEKIPTFLQFRTALKMSLLATPGKNGELDSPYSKLSLDNQQRLRDAEVMAKEDRRLVTADLLFLEAIKRQSVAGELVYRLGRNDPALGDFAKAMVAMDQQLRISSELFLLARESPTLNSNSMLLFKARRGEIFSDIMRLRLLPNLPLEEVVSIVRKPRFFERDKKNLDSQILARYFMMALLTGPLDNGQYDHWKRSKVDYESRHVYVARVMDGLIKDWGDDEGTVWAKLSKNPWDPKNKYMLDASLKKDLTNVPKELFDAKDPITASPLLRHLAITSFQEWDQRERKTLGIKLK